MPEGVAWGLESLYEYNGLVVNDLSVPNRYRLESITGLRGTPSKARYEDNPAGHGEIEVGPSKAASRNIVLRGVIEANNVLKLRSMIRAMERAFSSPVELPLRVYSDPRYVHQNLVPNPSFEVGVDGYTLTASSAGLAAAVFERSSSNDVAGSYSARYQVRRNDAGNVSTLVRSLTGSAGFPVVGGWSYAISLTAFMTTNPGTGSRINVYWYKADGTASSIASNSTLYQTGTGRKSWEMNIGAPADAAFASVGIATSHTPGGVESIVEFYIDNICVSPGHDTSYLDGDMDMYDWDGEPHNSKSTAMRSVEIPCKVSGDLDIPEDQTGQKIARTFMVTLKAKNPQIVSSYEKVKTVAFPTTTYFVDVPVENRGDGSSYFSIEVAGPITTDFYFYLTTTSAIRTTSLNSQLAAGQKLTFDSKYRSVVDEAGVRRPSKFKSTSDWLTIKPGKFTVHLRHASSAVFGVNGEQVTVRYRDTWLPGT